MLTRTIRRLLACLVLFLLCNLLVQAAADAGPPVPPKPGPGYELKCIATQGLCVWVLTSDRHKGRKPGGIGKAADKHVRPVCQFGGAAQACSDADLGNWSNGQQCYLQRVAPQPPASDPRWQGHTDGSVWACVREQGFDQGRHLVTRWVWLPGEPDTVVTDPLTLAYRAIAAMQLQAPQLRSAPGVGQIGLVNMPVWLWVEKSENTWGPIERKASVPGLTVTATAKVTTVDWTMGDGQTVRCNNAGTAYQKSFGIKPSPTCGHLYRKTSHDQPACKYKVTATTRWTITWQSTLGDTGQIPLTRQSTTQLQIGEAIPVLVDPNSPKAPTAPVAC